RYLAGSCSKTTIATRAEELSRSYDAWFFVLKPFKLLNIPGKAPSKYHKEVVEAIDEVSGGIRVGGGYHDIRAEATTKSPDDAMGLAALARWIPGLVPTNESDGQFIALMEQYEVRASGNSAVLTFGIPEESIRALLKS